MTTEAQPRIITPNYIEVSGLEALRTAHLIASLKNQATYLQNLAIAFLKLLRNGIKVIASIFYLNKLSTSHLRKSILPVFFAVMAYQLCETATAYLGFNLFGENAYDYVFKFMIGMAVCLKSCSYRFTDRVNVPSSSTTLTSSLDMLGIYYLYNAVFEGCLHLGAMHSKDAGQTLLAAVTMSLIAAPMALSCAVKRHHAKRTAQLKGAGAQRSDTTSHPAGKSQVMNWFLQLYAILSRELRDIGKIFQLGLIAFDILHQKKLLKFKNVLSLLINLIPDLIKQLRAGHKKLVFDREHNTKNYSVLRDGKLVQVRGHELRSGDLVSCAHLDLNNLPISGLVVVAPPGTPQEVAVNIKAYTGEDRNNLFTPLTTKQAKSNTLKAVNQTVIQKGTAPAVLVGSALDLKGNDQNCYIKILPQEQQAQKSQERPCRTDAEIARFRNQLIFLAVTAALGSAALSVTAATTWTGFLVLALSRLFATTQMFIPLSEPFLRQAVNNHMLPNGSTSTQGLLRLADFFNQAFYQSKPVIVSDKTGTLTTTDMLAKGVWLKGMGTVSHWPPGEIDSEAQQPKDQAKFRNFVKAFMFVYTNSPESDEPEEAAIRSYLKQHLKTDGFEFKPEVKNGARQHYLDKEFKCFGGDKSHKIQTVHLGLYKKAGGRFTLVYDETDRKYYLMFCGIPNADSGALFENSPLHAAYSQMGSRQGVLSRDWCIAKMEIDRERHTEILDLFDPQDTGHQDKILDKIKAYGPTKNFELIGNMLIDNPLKSSADKFVGNCRQAKINVIVATGDTPDAAKNIAGVLDPDRAKQVHTIKSQKDWDNTSAVRAGTGLSTMTFIFVSTGEGVPFKPLACLDELMELEMSERPNIIFSRMTVEDKGTLVKHLKKQGYTVCANGDGKNDIGMMQEAYCNIVHRAPDGSCPPELRGLADMYAQDIDSLLSAEGGDIPNDEEKSEQSSMYDKFDIHEGPLSKLLQFFGKISNLQQGPTLALLMKILFKLSFTLTSFLSLTLHASGTNPLMPIAFDLIWLAISFYQICKNADCPPDVKPLTQSWLPLKTVLVSSALAVLQSLISIYFFGQAMSVVGMCAVLAAFPTVLHSFLSGYRASADRLASIATGGKTDGGGPRMLGAARAAAGNDATAAGCPSSLLQKVPAKQTGHREEGSPNMGSAGQPDAMFGPRLRTAVACATPSDIAGRVVEL